MAVNLRRQTNAHGEWSVLDEDRQYRICSYNHLRHRGTHVHYPHNSRPLAALPVVGPAHAEAVMTLYASLYDGFDLHRLREVIGAWRSASAAS